MTTLERQIELNQELQFSTVRISRGNYIVRELSFEGIPTITLERWKNPSDVSVVRLEWFLGRFDHIDLY